MRHYYVYVMWLILTLLAFEDSLTQAVDPIPVDSISNVNIEPISDSGDVLRRDYRIRVGLDWEMVYTSPGEVLLRRRNNSLVQPDVPDTQGAYDEELKRGTPNLPAPTE